MTKQISELSQHIILYAKSWYEKSGNQVEDLRQLTSRFCLVDDRYISDGDVYRNVTEAFVESCNQQQYLELLNRLFYHPLSKPTSLLFTEAIEKMLGIMSCVQIKNDKEILITLCEPDYKLLPQPHKIIFKDNPTELHGSNQFIVIENSKRN